MAEHRNYPQKQYRRVAASGVSDCEKCGGKIAVGEDCWTDGEIFYHNLHAPDGVIKVVTIHESQSITSESK